MCVERSGATVSDGFVGVELDLQHSIRWRKQRASNRHRTKESTRSHGKLVLACGYLPPPPIEHEQGGLGMAESHLNTAGFHAVGTPDWSDLMLPPLQHTCTEVYEVPEKRARQRRQSRVRQHADLVRSQFSAPTAPSRHISKSPSSESVDEDTMPSRRSSSGLDESREQATVHWPHMPLTGRVHSPLDAQRYFERAMRDLDAAGRSDSVSGEFWSQYGELERNDGEWDTCGAMDLPEFI